MVVTVRRDSVNSSAIQRVERPALWCLMICACCASLAAIGRPTGCGGTQSGTGFMKFGCDARVLADHARALVEDGGSPPCYATSMMTILRSNTRQGAQPPNVTRQ